MFIGGKGGRWLGLTTLPSSRADCLEILEPQLLETSRLVQACNEIALLFYLHDILPLFASFIFLGEIYTKDFIRIFFVLNSVIIHVRVIFQIICIFSFQEMLRTIFGGITPCVLL
jgi:hypothetical protein